VSGSESKGELELPEQRAIGREADALTEEMTRLAVAIAHSTQRRQFDQAEALRRRLAEAARLLKRLIQFCVKLPSELPGIEGRRLVIAGRDVVVARGLMTPKDADGIAETALRRPKGRPNVLRSLTARALGVKLQNPHLTWEMIADQLRPVDYPKHAHPFAARLTRNVEKLRALLRDIKSFLKDSAETS
jgi:hypothetical protein